MPEEDYLQKILKTVREEGDKYDGEANLLAGIIKGLLIADGMVSKWVEKERPPGYPPHRPFKFHTVAEELEDLALEVLIDHPAFPHIRKDYPELKKQKHVKVVPTRGTEHVT